MLSRYALLFLFVMSIPAFCTAQEAGEINGSEHPELIDDRHALGMLFTLIADRPKAESRQRREETLASSGLSKEEIAIVFDRANVAQAHMNESVRKLRRIKQEHPERPLSAIALSKMDALGEVEKASFDNGLRQLEEDIGRAAFQQLTQFAREKIKPYMTVVPGK